MKFLVPFIKNKSFLFEINKESDNSSVSSAEIDMKASSLDAIVAKAKNQRNSTTKGNSLSQIIEAVKQRQILWNYNDPNFECSELKDEAWDEIEYELDIPAENCKKKWQCLKTCLASECAKHPDNRSSWTYFKQLDFVRKFIEMDNSKLMEQNDSFKASFSAVSETKNDIAEQVISEVKKYPLLWNLNSKSYKSTFKKQKAWKKIASSLEVPVDEVKKKWKGMRDVFVRGYGRNPNPRTNTYPYFKQMLFLTPHLKRRTLIRPNAPKPSDLTIESHESHSFSSVDANSDNNEDMMKKERRTDNNFTTTEFIEAIKKQHILWDPSFNNYKNNKLRCVVWQEVADYFGISVDDVKKKWKGLRDLFARNYNKPTIKEDHIHWKHYAHMKFLAPHIKEKKGDPLGSSKNPLRSSKNPLHLLVGDFKAEEKENSPFSSSEEIHNYPKNTRILPELSMEKFISVVKQHEVLWNIENVNHKRKEFRFKAWQEIADYFEVSKVDECKKRWKSLRDGFCRHYYKPTTEDRKSFKYYNEMKFLIPNLKYEKLRNNMPNDSSEEKQNAQKEEENFNDKFTEDDFSSDSEDTGRHDIGPKLSELICVDELIDKVKQYEILWNSNDENYKNIDLRTNAWKEIAAHFQSSVEDCRKKWKGLRDAFVRIYFKPIKEKYKGWVHYEKMKFLGPHVKHVKYKKQPSLRLRNDGSLSSSWEDKTQLFTVKEFVNEIKNHTILWDLSDERCKIKKYRSEAWREISAYFGISSSECKRKWAILRGAFIREFAKYPDNNTWENFKELDFLLPFLKANVSASNQLGDSKAAISSNVSKIGQIDDLISFDSNEINSNSQNLIAYPDESWMKDFIQLVKQHKILWDTTDINYKNALKRQQAWNKIAKEFGLCIDDSKLRWKSLCDTFFVCLSNDKSGKECSKWKHYDAMLFLRPHFEYTKLEEGSFETNNDLDLCSAKVPVHEIMVDDKSTFEFIEAVKEKQLLWNWLEDDHEDKTKKDQAWKQIANKFSSTVTCCKDRWLTLKNIYTRVILSSSIDRKYSWKYVEKMDFLRPFIKSHIDTPNFVEVSGCLDFDDIIEDCSVPEQPMVSKCDDQDAALYEEFFEFSPSQNIEIVEVQKLNTRGRAAAKRRKYSDTSSDDEDKEFFQGLKDTIKNLPSNVKSEAKNHIQAYLKVVSSIHSL